MGLNGKYFSKSILTAGADEDLLATLKTDLSIDHLMAKKLTLITSETITVNINGVGFSELYADLDGVSRLSLDADDVNVGSVVVHESGSTVFIAVVFS